MEKVKIPDSPAPLIQERNLSVIENVFERILWNSRFIVLLGVIFGVLSAIVLFIAVLWKFSIYSWSISWVRIAT